MIANKFITLCNNAQCAYGGGGDDSGDSSNGDDDDDDGSGGGCGEVGGRMHRRVRPDEQKHELNLAMYIRYRSKFEREMSLNTNRQVHLT